VEGVLITHAGVSSRYEQLFRGECGADVECLAASLNHELSRVIRRDLESGVWDEDGILSYEGPLWFRPGSFCDDEPLRGVRQVVGHSVPAADLERADFYMVDPCVFLYMALPPRFRYAVIESGAVTVIEADLPASLALRRDRGRDHECNRDQAEALCG
jgi:hypothetical protein